MQQQLQHPAHREHIKFRQTPMGIATLVLTAMELLVTVLAAIQVCMAFLASVQYIYCRFNQHAQFQAICRQL